GQNRDPATQLSHDWLVTPLACGVRAHDGQPAEEAVAAKVGYGQRPFLGGEASKANLCELLHPPAGKRPPALLFTASHGLARPPFVSRLPQRLLSHPRGAALAVIGHVDQGWGYSIQPYERVGGAVRPLANVGPQLTPFRNLLDDILRGIPVGHATHDLSAKYA